MGTLRRHLERQGYACVSPSYRSRQRSIARIVDDLVPTIASAAGGARLVAVTHSLGGVVLRHVATHIEIDRAVLIAPPNRGSQLAARVSQYRLGRWHLGRAGLELATALEAPVPSFPVGIVAGTRALNWSPTSWYTRAFGLFADEPSDGTVALAETTLERPTPVALVNAGHDALLRHPETRRLVERFLAHGSF